jgi:imidazolonepropionase-like amidohydrolase
MEMRRRNAQAVIRAGAIVTVGTDNYWASAPELARAPKVETQDHGIGTILVIEGLVELGMTPMQALVAATRNGAFAAGRDDLGALEAGNVADLLVLDANSLADIASIRKIRVLVANGRVIDRGRLPEARVLSRPPATSQ